MALLWPRHKGAVMSPTVKIVPEVRTLLKWIDVQVSKHNSALYEIRSWPLWCWACLWRTRSWVCSAGGVTLGSGKCSHSLRPPEGRGLHTETTAPQKPARQAEEEYQAFPAFTTWWQQSHGQDACWTRRTGPSSLKATKRFSSFLLQEL